MTCIVAYKHNGSVTIGGDSAAVDCPQLYARKIANPKVFKVGPYLIGYTSSFRMGQLLQYKIILPEPYGDLMHFMCTDFVDTVRQGFKDNGYSTINNNEESGGVFLIGIQDRIFELESDFSICEVIDNYTACGCGREFALGVIHALNGKLEPSELIRKALEASEAFSIGVLSPFTIITKD